MGSNDAHKAHMKSHDELPKVAEGNVPSIGIPLMADLTE